MCNLNKKKSLFFFFFHFLTLSLFLSIFTPTAPLHTLSLFLSIFTRTASLHAGTFTWIFLTMTEWLSYFGSLTSAFPQDLMTLCLCFSPLLKAEWSLFSFFSSLQFSACPTRLSQVSLRDMASLHQLVIKSKADFVGLDKLINEV